MPTFLAQSLIEWQTLSGITDWIGDTASTAWRALPPEVRNAPPWVWVLTIGVAMLLLLRFVGRPR